MRPANIELHIEELVLHGFAPGDRYGIGEAVERELQRLFAEQGALPRLAQDGEVAHLDGGAFEVARGARAETIGAQIAQTLHGGLSQ
jgi:hypothetical protein